MTHRDDDEISGVKLAFERDIVVLRLDQIVPLKSLRPGAKESKKYAQILCSVRAIGLVEAPVVTPDPKRSDSYFLLDGLIRIEALRDSGRVKLNASFRPMTRLTPITSGSTDSLRFRNTG